MRDAYLKNESFWSANVKTQDFGTMKFNVQCRDMVKPYIRTQIDITGGRDTWKWSDGSTNSFSLASAWQISKVKHQKFSLFNIIWHPHHCPKMAHSLYKAVRGRLPPKDRLCRFGIIHDDSCVLCSENVETINHLYFECEFSQYIWKLCKHELSKLESEN